jgi:NNP family nitrate/nitrite transporter-like MFS transporter
MEPNNSSSTHTGAAAGAQHGAQQQQTSSKTAAAASRSELPAGAPSQLAFKLPVDVENKAVELRLLSWSAPHMMAFHLSWICLFLTFTTTFAPAALLPVLQVRWWYLPCLSVQHQHTCTLLWLCHCVPDLPPLFPCLSCNTTHQHTTQQDALDLTRHDISHAGIASVCGTIFSRVAMGTMADAVGARYSAAIALLLTAPLMFGMALMQTAAGFIALRMLVGLGLSMFVVNQKWMGEMFNRQVVGRATALSAGVSEAAQVVVAGRQPGAGRWPTAAVPKVSMSVQAAPVAQTLQ